VVTPVTSLVTVGVTPRVAPVTSMTMMAAVMRGNLRMSLLLLLNVALMRK